MLGLLKNEEKLNNRLMNGQIHSHTTFDQNQFTRTYDRRPTVSNFQNQFYWDQGSSKQIFSRRT